MTGPPAARRPGRVLVTGAAGLVGQNLVPRLKELGHDHIVAIDKHPAAALRGRHPDIEVIEADLAFGEGWQRALHGAEALVVCHAQIGGLDPLAFHDNNVRATERLIGAARSAGVPYMVHVSSSAVTSAAVDNYTTSKKAQEAVVSNAGIPAAILRPTLMFGPFDRKHLGWLARFMAKAPLFPVPGHGRYSRQPLYVGDFCGIVAACIKRRVAGTFAVSGLERIDYIELIRAVRDAQGARTPIVTVPFGLFRTMLRAYALVDRNPPFTAQQLDALATPDLFEVTDWPQIFGVTPTPLREALRRTFRDPMSVGAEPAS